MSRSYNPSSTGSSMHCTSDSQSHSNHGRYTFTHTNELLTNNSEIFLLNLWTTKNGGSVFTVIIWDVAVRLSSLSSSLIKHPVHALLHLPVYTSVRMHGCTASCACVSDLIFPQSCVHVLPITFLSKSLHGTSICLSEGSVGFSNPLRALMNALHIVYSPRYGKCWFISARWQKQRMKLRKENKKKGLSGDEKRKHTGREMTSRKQEDREGERERGSDRWKQKQRKVRPPSPDLVGLVWPGHLMESEA